MPTIAQPVFRLSGSEVQSRSRFAGRRHRAACIADRPHIPPAATSSSLTPQHGSCSLSTSACRIRSAAAVLRSEWSLDVDIHLLADIDGRIVWTNPINHLQHASVDALRAVAGQRSFRHDVRFESYEIESDLLLGVAPGIGNGSRFGTHAPGVAFINISPDVEVCSTTHNHQGLARRAALRELTDPHFLLQNDPVERRRSRESFNVGCDLSYLGLRLRDLGARNC